jgi:ligand-binding sensor domain-containing protein/AraC-like DNA-binding protein/nitrogen-specific signal transduction histidine kinase
MKLRSLIFFILLFCIKGYLSAAIDVSARFITTNDGLANNSVIYMCQDKKGFIWIGTLNGLNRYDGHSFITFLPEKDKISLADNRVRSIKEDKNGFLWIYMSPEVFSCYDLEKECFVDFTGCGEYGQNYNKMFMASNGDIWLYHYLNGCRKISYRNGKFSSVIYKVERGNLPSNKINLIFEDTSGSIWVCTQSGLAKVKDSETESMNKSMSFVSATSFRNKDFFLTVQGYIYCYDVSKGFYLLKNLTLNKSEFINTGNYRLQDDWIILTSEGSYIFNLKNFQIKSDPALDIPNGKCELDNCGNYWIYNGTGYVYYLNVTTRKVRKFQLLPEALVKSIAFENYSIVKDASGIIWISTYGNGLFSYNSETEELVHFSYNTKATNSISSNFLFQVMLDRSGNIWTGVEHAGISLLSVLNEGASRIYPENETLVDRSNVIRLIVRMKDGNLLIGNRNGALYYYDKSLKKGKKENFFPYSIFSFKEDKDGKAWMGSKGDGLNIDGHWYKNDEKDGKSLSNNNIFDIQRDIKGRMWIGTFGGGLNLAVPKANGYSFRHFFTSSFTESQIRKIVEDKNGYFWVGGNNGVYVFKPDSLIADSTNYYLYNYNNRNLLSNEIHSIYCDSKGNMWIGTAGSGFSVCHTNGKYENIVFKHYTVNDGLANDIVQSFIEDKQGKMWISTAYGISRFDLKTKSFENFYFSATTLGNYYSEGCNYILDDGRLLFGTDHGLVVIDPEKVKPQKAISEVSFTDLKIDGLSMHPYDEASPLTKALIYTEKIVLKYFQNSFIIYFSTFDYSVMNSAKYSYKLDNVDNDWSIPSSLNFAAYKNLSPGKYRLHVKACNTVGLWTNKEAVLDIVIKPPFWKTFYAYILYMVFACLALYFTYKLIKNFSKLRNRLIVEKQLTDYKLVFFTNIAHEFRSPLTLIKGGLEKMAQIDNMPDAATQPMVSIRNSSKRLMRLIDQLLMFNKVQNKGLTLAVEEIDVITFIKDIFETFYESAFSKNILFRFIPFSKSYLMYVDQDYLDKILYNLLSNAFKFTPNNGSVTLMVSLDEEKYQLVIRVADTGIGIPQEKRDELFNRFAHINTGGNSFGIGLHLTKELVSRHYGTISYEENKGGGSIFVVNLPLSKSFYKPDDFTTSQTVVSEVEHEKKYLNKEKYIQELPLNNIRLLIIDDDEEIKEYIQTVMNEYFVTKTAPDGQKGLLLVKEFKPDIILCDVLMPDMSGFEVIKQLKKDKETSHIPVILLTSLTDEEDKVKGFECGADDYITKPFSVRLLLTRIINILEQRIELKEKFSKEESGISRMMVLADKTDKKFVDRMNFIINHNMADSSFDMDAFASAMGYKRTQFYQKVNSILGVTPNDYLLNARLKKAAELLADDKFKVSEIAYQVGFVDPSYFCKCFKTYYEMTPSQYRSNYSDKTEQ